MEEGFEKMILKIETDGLSFNILYLLLENSGYEWKEEDKVDYGKDWALYLDDIHWIDGVTYSKHKYVERIMRELENDI